MTALIEPIKMNCQYGPILRILATFTYELYQAPGDKTNGSATLEHLRVSTLGLSRLAPRLREPVHTDEMENLLDRGSPVTTAPSSFCARIAVGHHHEPGLQSRCRPQPDMIPSGS